MAKCFFKCINPKLDFYVLKGFQQTNWFSIASVSASSFCFGEHRFCVYQDSFSVIHLCNCTVEANDVYCVIHCNTLCISGGASTTFNSNWGKSGFKTYVCKISFKNFNSNSGLSGFKLVNW